MTEEQEYEYDVLDEFLGDVYGMYRQISERRNELEKILGHEISEEVSREFERAEWSLSDTEQAIRGRMNELNEDYCVRDSRYGSHNRWYNKRLAGMAKVAGINYVALDRVKFQDIEDAIRYIQENGLSSLNYNETCEAVKKFEAIRDRERWDKYHEARDIDTFALDLKVAYGDLDAVIEYLRQNGYSGKDMSSTCRGIEAFYEARRIA
ncbi:MAG: hypothetical protein IJG39_01920 [Synergistaceae bacterium]|nr:hypothetical protein [Synergistaceae bacterium]